MPSPLLVRGLRGVTGCPKRPTLFGAEGIRAGVHRSRPARSACASLLLAALQWRHVVVLPVELVQVAGGKVRSYGRGCA
eukprot:14602768-Alexandrium_andersonii.AAC.1